MPRPYEGLVSFLIAKKSPETLDPFKNRPQHGHDLLPKILIPTLFVGYV